MVRFKHSQCRKWNCLILCSRALEPFQKGEGPTFAAHIRAGVELFDRDEHSALVFSGYGLSGVERVL